MSTENLKYNSDIGQRLKAALVILNVKTNQLPDLAGVSAAQWSKYQRGIAEPGMMKIKFLFDRGISPAWLYEGKGEMFVNGSHDKE